jgi:hypothetical protein
VPHRTCQGLKQRSKSGFCLICFHSAVTVIRGW